MKTWLSAIGGLAFLTICYVPSATADEWNKRTEMTFSAPVELPGVVLPAGTYVFKLLDSPSDRDIVQVFNKNETHLYGTFLAIPDYRPTPASKTLVQFEERHIGTPEAIKEWFYPGDKYGREFVYPKSRAVQLAKATNQNVASMPNETAQNITKPAKTVQEPSVVALKNAPITAVNPTGAEVEVAQAAGPKPSTTTATPAPVQTAATTGAEHLPRPPATYHSFSLSVCFR